jgi:cation transport ATPase
VDGEVIAGNGVMDESYLTGEPFFISKAPGSGVLSGSINGDTSLTIKATKLAQDSRYAKIMQVMSESEQKRPRMRRLADQLGAWYTLIAIIIAISAWMISGNAIRFLAVLVIATPCPSIDCNTSDNYWVYFFMCQARSPDQKSYCFGTNGSMPNNDL